MQHAHFRLSHQVHLMVGLCHYLTLELHARFPEGKVEHSLELKVLYCYNWLMSSNEATGLKSALAKEMQF